jgi:hypothetical protein
MRNLDELMEAIDLAEVYETAKYLDKLGFVVNEISIGTLKEIGKEVYELVKAKGLH